MKVSAGLRQFQLLLLLLQLLVQQTFAQVHKKPRTENVVAEMQVVCHSDSIELRMNTNAPFNGMVYAKDAPRSDDCFSEYKSSTNMTFRLPLKSCGTLFAEADDGIEYFNTVVVQPHMRLMTNQGKGYHIRCKYQTRERTIANTHFNVSAAFLMQNNPLASTTPLLATASMPSCTMKIFRSGRDDVAETVKIGDKLIMVIEIDQQDMYGMKITNCVVRDGMNIAEQQLINDIGCPIDENIMPKFDYTNNSTRAAVSFPAHKFPHTSSVYYQCNVRLCINNGGCQQAECPNTNPNLIGPNNSNNSFANSGNFGGPRRKRFANNQREQSSSSSSWSSSPLLPPSSVSKNDSAVESRGLVEPLPSPSELSSSPQKRTDDSSDMSFDVYSGLYVSDFDVGESGSSDKNNQQVSPSATANRRSSRSANSEAGEICLTLGQSSLLILIASVASVSIVIMLVCQLGLVGKKEQQVPISRILPASDLRWRHQHTSHF